MLPADERIALLEREKALLVEALRAAQRLLDRCEEVFDQAVPAEEAFNPYAYGLPEEEVADALKAVLVYGEEYCAVRQLLEPPPQSSWLEMEVEGQMRRVRPRAVAWRYLDPEDGSESTAWGQWDWWLDVQDPCGNSFVLPLRQLVAPARVGSGESEASP